MPAITNTLTTFSTVGMREDLSDLIANVDPTECPFTANAGKGKAPNQTFYEWELDSYATPDTTNARNEGNDHTSFTAASQPVRVGNYCQISDKDIIVSDTQRQVNLAGRKSDLALVTMKRGIELKRDIEATMLQRNTGALNTDPRRTSTLLSYIRSNTVKGVGGADPAAPTTFYGGNRTDGTAVAFTEAMLKTGLATAYTNGVKVAGSVLMVDPVQKQTVSGFSGIATRFREVPKGQASIVGAADLYVSDFGEFTIVPNRFQRHRDAWFLDFSLIRFRDLRPYQVVPLAKTGDATKQMMVREWSVQVDNEKGLALFADLT